MGTFVAKTGPLADCGKLRMVSQGCRLTNLSCVQFKSSSVTIN